MHLSRNKAWGKDATPADVYAWHSRSRGATWAQSSHLLSARGGLPRLLDALAAAAHRQAKEIHAYVLTETRVR